ncbi:ribosomal biogenesis regulatory [Lecanosticta acicola]|uniref:Ribosome biogenesis regulatory protein n=1 Tax=Lecanosticta acicola TaxID=111012 RepID=A0AAI8YZ00_9PEZI|nr:ribosomal biogenesis regulatory [Lecanosticta acicola]
MATEEMEISETRAQPYTFDLGHMLCIDSNPLPTFTPTNKEEILKKTAQSCAQALINQLLTTCPIKRSDEDGGLQIDLPAPETQLPREKPVPKEKEKTKWEKFAEKKGIKAKKKDGKLVFDEAKGDWVPKYGYKGKKGEGMPESDWLVEVDEKAERKKAREAEEEKNGKKAKAKGMGDIARRDRKLKMRKAK